VSVHGTEGSDMENGMENDGKTAKSSDAPVLWKVVNLRYEWPGPALNVVPVEHHVHVATDGGADRTHGPFVTADEQRAFMLGCYATAPIAEDQRLTCVAAANGWRRFDEDCDGFVFCYSAIAKDLRAGDYARFEHGRVRRIAEAWELHSRAQPGDEEIELGALRFEGDSETSACTGRSVLSVFLQRAQLTEGPR
jgi:hypothetical protein